MKTQNNYFLERDKINRKQINERLAILPQYCREHILSLENTTSSLTRLGYVNDLAIFFDFISRFKFDIPIAQISFAHIEKITALDINSFLSYLSFYNYNGKNYKNGERGKARKLASIRSLFKFLFCSDYIKSDVASKVTTPKMHDKEIIRLNSIEVNDIIEEAEMPYNFSIRQQNYLQHTRERDVAILTLFLGTGIRVSELVGLNLEDFDFETMSFKITRKGGNQAVLYFSDEVKFALTNWLENRATREIPTNEKAMFTSLQNRRISVRAVEKLVKKYAQAITPLKKITPHKLRSTYGTSLYHATQDIYIVADVLGHRDVNTTKKHYAAMSEDLRQKAADKIKLRKEE